MPTVTLHFFQHHKSSRTIKPSLSITPATVWPWYHGFWLRTMFMFDHVHRWCDCGVWPWSVVAENLLHFPSEEICHQKYFLTAKATINSSLKHRRPFFRKRCVLKVSLTILISHYSSKIPYFQVQWRTFSIFMYSIKINVLYFLK